MLYYLAKNCKKEASYHGKIKTAMLSVYNLFYAGVSLF